MSKNHTNPTEGYPTYPLKAHENELRQSPLPEPIIKRLGRNALGPSVVAALAVLSSTVTGLSGATEARIYPYNQPSFIAVNDDYLNAGSIPNNGEKDKASSIDVDYFIDNSAEKDITEDLYLFFPGFGNVSDHAAEEFNKAMGQEVNAFYLKQANQGLLINETADKLRILIEEQKPKYINIVCTSMGFNTALETIVALLNTNPELELPLIKYLVPNSSPASIEDAMDGRATDVSGLEGLNPGLRIKYLYSLVDGKGDAAKAINPLNRMAMIKHWVVDSFEQTVNHSPQKLDWGRMKSLGRSDVDAAASILIERGVISPDTTTIFYLKAAIDNTVKQDDSIVKIKNAFKDYKVVVIGTPANHANTAEGAIALSDIIRKENDSAPTQLQGNYDKAA